MIHLFRCFQSVQLLKRYPYFKIIMSIEQPLAKISKKCSEPTIVANNKNVQEKAKVNNEFNSISDDGSVLCFKKLSEHAQTPVRGSRNAAGFDLFSAEAKIIKSQSHGLVKTDIAVSLPKGSYGRVAPRSGLALKKFIDVGAGVVDYDYRGNVGVVLFNHFQEDFVVERGDRIAQFVVEKIFMPQLVEVQELDDTDRGSSGYGSTGR